MNGTIYLPRSRILIICSEAFFACALQSRHSTREGILELHLGGKTATELTIAVRRFC